MTSEPDRQDLPARDQEARLRVRLAHVATLDEVAPGFADAPPPAAELVP